MAKQNKERRRYIEYVWAKRGNKPWQGCNEPKAGDLLSVDMVFKAQLEMVLEPFSLKIGPLVKPFKGSTINGWYKLEAINAKKKA